MNEPRLFPAIIHINDWGCPVCLQTSGSPDWHGKIVPHCAHFGYTVRMEPIYLTAKIWAEAKRLEFLRS